MTPTVYIDGRLIGYRYGGIANYARNLADVAPGLSPDMTFRLLVNRHMRNRFDRAHTMYTPPHHRLERWTLGLELGWRSPDVLHSTDYIHPRLAGVRHVVTIHDLAFLRRPEYVTSDALAYYGKVRATASEADHVIAVSEWTKSQIIEYLGLPTERITVVPNGVDHTRFTPCDSADVDRLATLHPELNSMIESGRPIILAVGTVEPRKRLDLLLNAVQLLSAPGRPEDEAPVLVVVGQAGWLAERTIARLRELQRRGVVVWLRSTTDHELAALYRTSTLFVMTSEDEGFGLPALEAMASGTPVLVASRGALPEIVGDAGVVEESDDAGDWASAITRLLSEPWRRDRLSRAGIKQASEFSWARTARKTIDVYREVLSR